MASVLNVLHLRGVMQLLVPRLLVLWAARVWGMDLWSFTLDWLPISPLC